MRTIEINKGGFGVASLFADYSTKGSLIKKSNLQGKYLDELGIKYNIGDTITLKTPLKRIQGHKLSYIRVYNITDSLYECEFIDRIELT